MRSHMVTSYKIEMKNDAIYAQKTISTNIMRSEWIQILSSGQRSFGDLYEVKIEK